jgi:spore coat protein CotH
MFNKSMPVLFALLVASCGGGGGGSKPLTVTPPQSEVLTENPVISQFSFLMVNNPELPADINLTIDDQLISGRLPTNSPVDSLIASFETEGSTLEVGAVTQNSGSTANDFSGLVNYKVTTGDGRQATYSVDLTKFTDLPIIYLSTTGSAPIESKDDYIQGVVTVDGGRDFAGLTDAEMKIRGRGNSTWDHPKKPFQMKLADKSEMLGMPRDKKWLFLAEYSDKTLLRNTIAFEMGYLSNLDWTPKSEFAEVYLNQEYNGTYNITQKVEEDDDRVALGDDGFLLEIDQLYRLDPDDVYFETNEFLINIKAPDVVQDDAQFTYIKNLISQFEVTLFSGNYRDAETGYAQLIDMDSFVDWYLINEITKNQDAQSFSSIYLNVIPGETIKMGPLWDFDLAFGNVDYSDSRYANGFHIRWNPWYNRMFSDPVFIARLKERFAFFRANQGLIVNKIDSYAQKLAYAQQENNDKWQTMGTYVWPNPVIFDTYEEEVEHLKRWYSERMDWLEAEFNAL